MLRPNVFVIIVVAVIVQTIRAVRPYTETDVSPGVCQPLLSPAGFRTGTMMLQDGFGNDGIPADAIPHVTAADRLIRGKNRRLAPDNVLQRLADETLPAFPTLPATPFQYRLYVAPALGRRRRLPLRQGPLIVGRRRWKLSGKVGGSAYSTIEPAPEASSEPKGERLMER